MIDSGVILNLLLAYKYAIFFPLTIIEGPIVTMTAGFLASMGQMNFWAVFVLAILGDIAGDWIYYAIGRFGGARIFNWFRNRSEKSGKRIENIERLFEKHSFKTLFLGKITHAIGWVVLFGAGSAKMPFGKFTFYTFLPTIPKVFTFLLIGYYFGWAYLAVNKYLGIFSYVVFALIIVTGMVIYFIPRKIGEKIMKED